MEQRAKRRPTGLTALKQAGIEAIYHKNKVATYEKGGNLQVPCKPNITELTQKWLPKIPGLYGLASGSVHAAFWLTVTSIDFSTDEMRTTGDAEIVLTASLAPCFALQAVTTGAYQLHRLDISTFQYKSDQMIARAVAEFQTWKGLQSQPSPPSS
ncbi:hypothetical protein [Lentzea atacamensis]|uniref:hypothetical protein n=1 Tax=Lentzea atacamensis TaxID=531938 RepID=UPI0011B80ECB|nr:hypothetical protein [Lentzea atacamensis]